MRIIRGTCRVANFVQVGKSEFRTVTGYYTHRFRYWFIVGRRIWNGGGGEPPQVSLMSSFRVQLETKPKAGTAPGSEMGQQLSRS